MFGTLPSKHTISSQEVTMSGGKQNVRELLDNFKATNLQMHFLCWNNLRSLLHKPPGATKSLFSIMLR